MPPRTDPDTDALLADAVTAWFAAPTHNLIPSGSAGLAIEQVVQKAWSQTMPSVQQPAWTPLHLPNVAATTSVLRTDYPDVGALSVVAVHTALPGTGGAVMFASARPCRRAPTKFSLVQLTSAHDLVRAMQAAAADLPVNHAHCLPAHSETARR